MEKTFIEKDCCITFGGKKFCSGGSLLGLNRKTGKHQGLFYAYPETKEVGTWDGKKKVRAKYLSTWINNMGDRRQSVYFTWDNLRMYGVYFLTNSSIIRAKEIKEG